MFASMILVYCYDAYCGWCYGFSAVMKKIAESYAAVLPIEVLSGGMILPEKPTHISSIATYIQQAYKTVENHTGIKFGQDFLWHIFNPDKSDWYLNSEKPAVALSVIKEWQPNNALSFATDMQYALNYEGRDLTDDEAYRHLIEKYNLDADQFYKALHSEYFKEKAYQDFALVKQLRVDGFPAVFLQLEDEKYYQVAKGYTNYETLKSRIDTVLKEQ